MSLTHNIFCPECDSILDISKSSSKKNFNIDITPSSVSDGDDNFDKIADLINKLLKDDDVEIENIKPEQITNHVVFQKLDKNKKQIIVDKLNQNKNLSNMAFYVCKTCGWSQKIKPGTQILSKIGMNTNISYGSINKYKNKIHCMDKPFTRNYICPNSSCPGNKDSAKHEAVMYRVGSTMQIMYTCCACKEVFVGQ